MAKLTVKQLEALRPEHNGTTIRDDGNLIGRVRVSGSGEELYQSVSFYFRYKRNQKLHDLSCGTWPKTGLLEIRANRDKARSLLAQGIDPVNERKAAKLKAKADLAEAIAAELSRLDSLARHRSRKTIRDLFEHWSKIDLLRHKDGGKEIRRMFEKDVLPRIGDLAVEDITKAHVLMVVDEIQARGVHRMAKMIFSLMRQMFRFAQDREIIDNDPTAAIRKAKVGGKDTERDRVLSEDEIKELHAKLPNARLMQTTELAVWLCLSTCCRIGELMRAAWIEIDFDHRTWRIPAENSKNGKPHLIYLSEFAYFKFRELYSLTGGTNTDGGQQKQKEWCFPDRSGTKTLDPKTVTKQLGDRQREVPPMKGRSNAIATLQLSGGNWTPHDLRRTGATMMTALGVLPEVAERCLNHTEQDRIKRTYQRHTYEKEMRIAWGKLGERLELLISSESNVIVGAFGH